MNIRHPKHLVKLLLLTMFAHVLFTLVSGPLLDCIFQCTTQITLCMDGPATLRDLWPSPQAWTNRGESRVTIGIRQMFSGTKNNDERVQLYEWEAYNEQSVCKPHYIANFYDKDLYMSRDSPPITYWGRQWHVALHICVICVKVITIEHTQGALTNRNKILYAIRSSNCEDTVFGCNDPDSVLLNCRGLTIIDLSFYILILCFNGGG